MVDQLRDRMTGYLATHTVGVLSAGRRNGVEASVVRYHNHGLQVECLVPRWAGAAYYLQKQSRMVLIIPTENESTCWMQYVGVAGVAAEGSWTHFAEALTSPYTLQDRYLLVEITPRRIDLIDQRHGWGARETLELG